MEGQQTMVLFLKSIRMDHPSPNFMILVPYRSMLVVLSVLCTRMELRCMACRRSAELLMPARSLKYRRTEPAIRRFLISSLERLPAPTPGERWHLMELICMEQPRKLEQMEEVQSS